ncbi:hypothetical protein AB0L63_24665 [Nocardia sp. NPDC051990]|uniref:hypothetical protein n=1 Tax=Nocardia sp. NPDC051990 TaxID=3155285 RepID=UPI00343026DA
MFTFGIEHTSLYDYGTKDGRLGDLPPDLLDVIGPSGDKYRDPFTRACLYLVRHPAATTGRGDTIVIGTEYGNTAALAQLQRAAADQGRLLSAQHFPNATSSSAAAFLAINVGATGPNTTLNAARLTPAVALWRALLALASAQSTTSHLLIGDIYAPEASLDDRAAQHRDGVAYGKLCATGNLRARFDFSVKGTASGGGFRIGYDGGQPAREYTERNGAFATMDFLSRAQTLSAGETVVFECFQSTGQRAEVVVTKGRALR